MLNVLNAGTPHSNAPAALHWGLKGSADAPPGTGVFPAACAGAGGTVGNSCYTVGLGEKNHVNSKC